MRLGHEHRDPFDCVVPILTSSRVTRIHYRKRSGSKIYTPGRPNTNSFVHNLWVTSRAAAMWITSVGIHVEETAFKSELDG